MGLREEGWGSVSQVPPIKLSYQSGSSTRSDVVATLRQMWKNVLGIDVELESVNSSELRKEIAAATNNPNGLQFWLTVWVADYPDPQDWLTLQFDKGVPNNNTNYGQNNSADVL